jgi:hypothetical protein
MVSFGRFSDGIDVESGRIMNGDLNAVEANFPDPAKLTEHLFVRGAAEELKVQSK